MMLHVKHVGLVLGLAMLAGAAFLAGQLSTPSSASAQSGSCVVAATHTGKWFGNQIIWKGNRPAVVTITNSSDSYAPDISGDQYITVNPRSGATVTGNSISISRSQ